MPAAHPLGRFGLVVGRKALPRATDRNRFKRLVRAAMRDRRAEAIAYDVVVRLKGPVKRAAVDAAAGEAGQMLARAFAALRARCAP